jgi:hypothetical protein
MPRCVVPGDHTSIRYTDINRSQISRRAMDKAPFPDPHWEENSGVLANTVQGRWTAPWHHPIRADLSQAGPPGRPDSGIGCGGRKNCSPTTFLGRWKSGKTIGVCLAS